MATICRRPYTYPPRASTAIPKEQAFELYGKMGFIAQLKYNDSRALFDYDNSQLTTIWDRHKRALSADTTAINPALSKLGDLMLAAAGPGRYLLDGGLLHSKHAAIKSTIVIWDILIRAGDHLLSTTYGERYNWLYSLYGNEREHYYHQVGGMSYDLGLILSPMTGDRIIIPETLTPDRWEAAWGTVESINANYDQPLIEGLVFKLYCGILEPGFKEANNSTWLGRSRVATARHVF